MMLMSTHFYLFMSIVDSNVESLDLAGMSKGCVMLSAKVLLAYEKLVIVGKAFTIPAPPRASPDQQRMLS